MKKNILLTLKVISILINTVIAFILYPLVKMLNLYNKNTWVFGGAGGDFYDDNSAALHQYVIKNYPEINVYWIAEKKSKDINKIKKHSKVIFKHSIKAILVLLTSKVIIGTHNIRYDIMRVGYKMLKSGLKVQILHGIITYRDVKVLTEYYDIILATSVEEKKMKQNWNVDDKIYITGFPRFDTLIKRNNFYKKNKGNKNILFMPTWRNYIRANSIMITENDKNTFLNSDYFKAISTIIKSKKINNFLQKNNIKMNVVIHKLFFKYSEFYSSNLSNIIILEDNISILEQIAKNDMLITDYSSVAGDFLFLDKPVLFYQFDRDYFLSRDDIKPVFKVPEDLWGKEVFNENEILEAITVLSENNFEDNSKQKNIMRKKYFDFLDDTNNCKRVTDLIVNKLTN